MPIEKSAGAIVFKKEKNAARYLLLHYGAGHWDFPKGHVEKGESEKDTVRRETEEETEIKDLQFVPGFRKQIRYFFRSKRKTIMKIVVFYLAETKHRNVKLSFEHTAYKWLPYSAAKNQLTFKNAKKLLTEANNVLLSR